ncbi:hypothetical protein [Nocardia arthritidis]|uniref:Uncharacterized protein n=1 Tax=Nocardia arthritidis TaxID=228602 RepID=A0A6G9YS26_9NOCA|nr:hypothetical protein [Nocardia arthritidis]QIS16115.1 hypothetical protein F5544_41525 [Nocardia arthritidis]
MTSLKFVRRTDGLTYEFVDDGTAHGYPSYKRIDLDLWCERLPEFGWVLRTADGVIAARPFDDAGHGALPPGGAWVSRKGDRSYVYDVHIS